MAEIKARATFKRKAKRKARFAFVAALRLAATSWRPLFGAGLQVAGWGFAELFAEHGDERAGAVVSRIEGRGSDFLARSEALHGMKEAKLLAPPAERHFCFFTEEPLNGSLACAALPAQSFQFSVVPRAGD
jgi:hypothetical protein